MFSEVIGQDMLIIAASITIGTLTYGLIARWYVVPALATRSINDALIALVLPHAFRYIGLASLIPGIVSPDISPEFSVPAAYGDLLASVLALLAVAALKSKWSIAVPAVWIFNLEGTLDALYAVSQGLQHVDAGQLGGVVLIPLLIVPALFVTHIMIFQVLLKRTVS